MRFSLSGSGGCEGHLHQRTSAADVVIIELAERLLSLPEWGTDDGMALPPLGGCVRTEAAFRCIPGPDICLLSFARRPFLAWPINDFMQVDFDGLSARKTHLRPFYLSSAGLVQRRHMSPALCSPRREASRADC